MTEPVVKCQKVGRTLYAAYTDGRVAAEKNQARCRCPYHQESRRFYWFQGFDDARDDKAFRFYPA